jgi:hypothetical protein
MADMSVNIKTPQLDGIIERLDPGARAELHREIAAEISETVRDHLRSYALSHHKRATELGARPTGNLEDAKVEAFSDSDGATVTVAALGIRRALGPLEIRPKNKQALTIPVAAISYGRSVAYLKAHGIDVFRPKGKDYLAYKENPKSQFSTVIYILARRATLKHEPDLLPRKEELAANALEAARDYIMEGNAA